MDILLVEPNPDDARLFTEAFDDATIKDAIYVVHTGEEALDFVHQRGDYGDVPHPDIVLLDLDLPDMSGDDVLATLKGTSEFRRIPVIVLTTSDAPEDVTRSYDHHANAYIQKPTNPDGFAELARIFEEFWLSFVRLPPKE